MSTTLLQPLPGSTLPTYTETQGAKPFDWHAFLAKQSHTDDEWHEAVNLAGGWVTCACGNQCAALERNPDGSPEDTHLYLLGEAFGAYILERKLPDARETLDLIERRSALLLMAQAALAGKECNACGGLGCPTCHGGSATKAAAPEPCGGCGASHPNERCMGCRHDFKVLGAWDGKDQTND